MTYTGKFHVPIYECDVFITVTDNILKSINNRLRLLELSDRVDDPVGAYILRPGDSVSKYWLFFDPEVLSVNEINHEKSHLVEYILKDRDIIPKGEVRAYLDGYISKQVDKFFKVRKKIKIKP